MKIRQASSAAFQLILCLLLGMILPAAPALALATPSDAPAPDPSAHLSNYERLSNQLSVAPANEELRLSCTKALVSYIRSKTNANALMLKAEGGVATSDTPENIAIWKERASEALALVKPLLKSKRRDSPEVASLYAEALTYKESSRGIVTSATSGGAVLFLSATGVLYNKHRLHDGAVSCIYKGAFHLATPWPIGSAKKGARFFDEAYEAFPESKRNCYYAALGAWAVGDRNRTIKLMRKSLVAPRAPQGASELDIEGFLDGAARQALEVLGESSC